MNINLDISGSKDVIYVDEQDTSTSIVFYIKDNGSAVDLTGLTLSFVLHRTSYIVAPLTITSASSGIATLTLTSAMTASPGTLAFEVVGMESDDTPEFDISSYMVVQKVYSGSDGQNDPDEENPGIDVLYGEDAPDDDDDGEDKDFYFKFKVGSDGVLNEDDYTAETSPTHPISITSFEKVNETTFNFDITGVPSNAASGGVGENIYINMSGLIEGVTYTVNFDGKYSDGTTFPYYPQYDAWAYIVVDGVTVTSIKMESNTQKHSYTGTFVAGEENQIHYYLASKDDVETTLSITDFVMQGSSFEFGDIDTFYNKYEGKWFEYRPPVMIGATASADGVSGAVPQPMITDKDKVLKGDGTWGTAGTSVEANPSGTATDTMTKIAVDGTIYEFNAASAVSDLTDVELTNLADGEILKYDATSQKWLNAVESGGGGGSLLIQNAQIYSLDEKQVGVWIDNKPLYQKCLPFNNQNSTMLNIDVSALNIDKCVQISAYVNATGYDARDYYDNSSDKLNAYFSRVNNTIDVRRGSGAAIGDGWAIIQYTKTTDRAGSGGYQAYGFSPIIYSEEEREVGVWIDNKPLYAKTYPLTNGVYISGSGAVLTSYIDNQSVIDKLIQATGIYSPQNNACTSSVFLARTNGAIKAWCSEAGTFDYINIFYTKTTDTAGSGSYNTLGVPNVHYTEDEQVIGTYLGKPLYQKTIVTNMASGATTKDIPFTGCNIKRMIDLVAIVDGTSSSGNAITCTINGIVSGNNGAITIKSLSSNGAYGFFDDAGVQIKRSYAAWFEPNMQIEVTIKYTKTTD